jgi:hypothetical protein
MAKGGGFGKGLGFSDNAEILMFLQELAKGLYAQDFIINQ